VLTGGAGLDSFCADEVDAGCEIVNRG